jgi:origin recognition complex subunit 2
MKRKSLNDEGDLNNGDSPSRKRSRSHNPSAAEINSRDDIQEFTPTKPRSARPKAKDAPQYAISDEDAEDAGGHDYNAEPQEKEPTNTAVHEAVTPTKRGRGRPKGSKNTPKKDGETPKSKKLLGKKLFATPVKSIGSFKDTDSPSSSFTNGADRSARRKVNRNLIERTMNGEVSEDEEDEDIERHIYGSDKEDELDVDAILGAEVAPDLNSEPTTPSKRGRGRPKGSKNRKLSPVPTGNLPPHELYFAQNRNVAMKTSNNTLSSLSLLDHEEYFTLLRAYQDPHTNDLAVLQKIHSNSFPQWEFELSQSFNICIYGWGSKRALLTSFAHYIHTSSPNQKTIIVNGYNASTSIREVFSTIFSALPNPPKKSGTQPAEMLDKLLTCLSATDLIITLIIHSLDAPPLRRASTQALLARLAAHPQLRLVASVDHPQFPLLWDSSHRTSFNFVFHDCTTFAPYSAEIDVVDTVNGLLGRSGRRVGGKEGVGFVLRSLPANARSLFRLLVTEQLMAMDDGIGGGEEEDGEEEEEEEEGGGRMNGNGGWRRMEVGVEYRMLYQKAVEDFICGDEVAFRQLLKEYVFSFSLPFLL